MITVKKLHDELAKLIEKGHGRKPVCINKSTFTHQLEQDGCLIIGVEAMEGPKWIANADDDGGMKFNADGTESGRLLVILKGE